MIISVPIEIGPTLAVKQAVRAAAAASGLNDTRNASAIGRPSSCAWCSRAQTSEIDRPVTVATTAPAQPIRFHGHKGFNWHILERKIERAFTIERRLYSPVPLTGPLLNSQVWFVCRKR